MKKYYCNCNECQKKSGGKPRLVNTQTLRAHRLKQKQLELSIKRLQEQRANVSMASVNLPELPYEESK